MTDEQRRDIFRIWKDEYHGPPLQQELQRRDSWRTSEKSNGKGKGRAIQRTGKGKGSGTQPAVKGKFFATGGKTKTGKEATLPPLLGPSIRSIASQHAAQAAQRSVVASFAKLSVRRN